MDWQVLLVGFVAGAVISTITAPVGVSGAVFLLPVQMSVLGVANPAVTPTNLLYNVVAGPGALLRYRRSGALRGKLTRTLLLGTLPGVVIGALIRVLAIPGPHVFRIIVAVLLLPLGLWLCVRAAASPGVGGPVEGTEPSERSIRRLASIVGVVGGIYGIGGGSILGPILVGRGMSVTEVAPAALASTFVTSVVGAATFGVLALTTSGDIAPNWSVGIACGLGGLLGGHTGARLQPHVPERGLRALLGTIAVLLALVYLVQAIR